MTTYDQSRRLRPKFSVTVDAENLAWLDEVFVPANKRSFGDRSKAVNECINLVRQAYEEKRKGT